MFIQNKLICSSLVLLLYVYLCGFAVCIYALVFFMALSKRELPKAEMKGIEHGSNDFQTEEERNDFLEKNTTPIYSLDLHEFKGEGKT